MIKGLYVELDALFDTRIGLINHLDKDLSLRLLGSDEYIYRAYDEFEHIGNNVFNDYYRNRNIHVLKNSFITKLIEIIIYELDLIVTKKIEVGDTTKVDLDINTYPYVLTDHEKELFRKAIIVYNIVPDVDINIIYLDTKELTLVKIANYSVAFMYDAVSWLEYQLAVSLNSTAIEVKLFGPALLKEALQFNKVKALENLFKMQSEVYQPYIDYTAMGVEYFCNRPIMLEKIKDKYK